MKNSTLIALLEAHELPGAFIREWSCKNRRTPIDDAKQEIREQESYSRIGWGFLGISTVSMISVFLVMSEHKWTAEIPFTVFYHLFPFFLILCVLSFGAAVVLIAFSQNDSQSDFGTQLEQLREVLGLTYGEMSVWKLNDLRERAENTLRAQAEYVKALQGSHGENSLSDRAKEERTKYEEMHSILFTFGLCEEKWDKYWKTPKQEKREGVAV